MKIQLTPDDIEFENQFSNCYIASAAFTHDAHLRLAYIHISRYGLDQAEKNIQSQLQAFVSHVGATDKYNTTLTLAAIKAVYHFICRATSDNFNDFIAEFPRLKYNFKELMDSHYGFDIYYSDRAKKQYLEPDLIPF